MLRSFYVSKNSIKLFDENFQTNLERFYIDFSSFKETLLHSNLNIYELDLTFQKIAIINSNSFEGSFFTIIGQ